MFPHLIHELVDDAVHVLHDILAVYVFADLANIGGVQRPLGMHLADVFELMVEMFVVELQRADCFDFALTVLVDAQRYHLLLVFGAAILFHSRKSTDYRIRHRVRRFYCLALMIWSRAFLYLSRICWVMRCLACAFTRLNMGACLNIDGTITKRICAPRRYTC